MDLIKEMKLIYGNILTDALLHTTNNMPQVLEEYNTCNNKSLQDLMDETLPTLLEFSLTNESFKEAKILKDAIDEIVLYKAVSYANK